MGKRSEFDLGKLCLFSHVNKGKWIMIRKHLARSVHVGLRGCSWNWRLSWLWHQFFFPFLGLPHDLNTSHAVGCAHSRLCLWYLALGCCQNKVPGTWWREILLPGSCSCVASSETLYLLLSTLAAKSNMQHSLLGYHFQGKIIKHAFSLGIPAGVGNLLFRKSRCRQGWKIKCQCDVEGLFGMNLRWPHWAVKPIKSLY